MWGDWQGDNWFVTQGLKSGERIVVDGAIRVAAGAPLKIVGTPGTSLAAAEGGGAEQTSGDSSASS